MNAFQEYVARRGATAELARVLGVTPAAIRQWDGHIPAERVVAVEAATGIPREALRPDLFRREPRLA